MKVQDTIKKVTDIAQNGGWSVSVEEMEQSNVHFEFQRFTNFGQDLNFYADMLHGDLDTLVSNVRQYYEGFDVDYEASLWIGENGHGKRGAPYHIKDIVTDMEEAEEKMYDLLCELEFETFNE